jgi:hypothetical protein
MTAAVIDWKFDIGDSVRPLQDESAPMTIVDRYHYDTETSSRNVYGCRDGRGGLVYQPESYLITGE